MARRLQSWLSIVWLVAGLGCLVFVAVYAAASAAQTVEEPKLKTLWDEYPLDPSASESPAAGSKQARSSDSAAPRQRPAASRPVPAVSRQRPAATDSASAGDSDSSSSLRLGLLAGVGLAVLLAAVSALSLLVPTRRRKRRAPPAVPAAPAKRKTAALATAAVAPAAPARPKRKKLQRAQREPQVNAPERVVATTSPAAPRPQRALPAAPSASGDGEPARAPERERRTAAAVASATPPTEAPKGRAAASPPAGETRPAVRAERPQRQTGEPGPNGSARPATTWFTEPHESCEIALWRGYVRGQFYARPTFPEPGDYALEVSPKFRLRGESPNPRGSALAAYEALIEKLVRRGWQPSGLGGEWFEQWFRRRLPTEHGFPPVEPTPAPPTRTPAGPSSPGR